MRYEDDERPPNLEAGHAATLIKAGGSRRAESRTEPVGAIGPLRFRFGGRGRHIHC